MSSTIRFYFDYVSPNAYLAWTQLPTIAEKYAFTVEPVPVLFAGLLEAHGQLGPAEVPAKMRWMSKNNLRKAALLRVVMNPPAFHPFNSLLALRVSSLPLETPDRWALIDALFRAVWVRGLHVSEAAVVEKIADEIGLRGGAIVSEAQHPSHKGRLRAQTDDAIARGVFGVPTMEVGNELFWGYDDFLHFRALPGGEGSARCDRVAKVVRFAAAVGSPRKGGVKECGRLTCGWSGMTEGRLVSCEHHSPPAAQPRVVGRLGHPVARS